MLVSLIADELEVKRQEIFLLDDVLDLHPVEVTCGPAVSYDYNEEDTLKIMEYFHEKRKKQQEIEKINKEQKKREHQEYIERMKKEHPLVTDERCFNLTWFPDVVPNCFKGKDYED